MIKRKKQKIISGFGWRTRNGKKEFHRGIDLRSWNLKIWKRQPIIFPERCEVLRTWIDRWGGGIAYKGLVSGLIFKSIHIKVNADVKKGMVFEKGEIIGFSEKVKGILEHEHFETLIKDTHNYSWGYCLENINKFWVNPLIYIKKTGWKYGYK